MRTKGRSNGEPAPLNFKTLPVEHVPLGRRGKHHAIVEAVISDLERLDPGMALRIPLADLKEGKARVRSALNRATHKLNFRVATSSDDSELFVWRLAD